MRHHRLLKLSIIAILALPILVETAEGGILWRWLNGHKVGTRTSEPSAPIHGKLIGNQGWKTSASEDVFVPRINEYGLGEPPFAWGYFGAHPRSTVNTHRRGYYDDYRGWQFQRGR